MTFPTPGSVTIGPGSPSSATIAGTENGELKRMLRIEDDQTDRSQ
jgi:hypothetical protein